MIQPSTIKDLKEIANCHRSAFPKSFSAKLGQEYCEKMFEWYIVTDNAFLFHLKKNDEIIGYVGSAIAGSFESGPATIISQYCFKLALKSLLRKPYLLFSKKMIKHYKFIFKNIFLKLKLKKQNPQRKERFKKKPEIGLIVIGVNPKYHSKGIGSRLLVAFDELAKKLNISTLQLTVKSNNNKAIKSYIKNGWKIKKKNKEHYTLNKSI